MIDWVVWVVLGLLVLASYLDLKYKAVPSVILTGALFTVLMMRPYNLIFGVIAFVFAILIRDLISDVAGMEFGVADIKIMAIIGLLVSNAQGLFLMILLFCIFQFVYTLIWRWQVEKTGEMPFIPCLTAIYVAMMILGGVA